MFWTDWGEAAKIERAGMDGSDRRLIISQNIYWPNGLTVDHYARRIYWTDAKLDFIERANYKGSKRQKIVKDALRHPFGLSIYDGVVYWTDWDTRAILSYRTTTRANIHYVKRDIYSPMDISVYEADRQPMRPRGWFQNNIA